jgi:hypothetical protein
MDTRAVQKPTGKRVLVYDGVPRKGERLLRMAWAVGARLYKRLGWIDAAHGAQSWQDALTWIANHDGSIQEIQFWGHGKWGMVFIDNDVLAVSSLRDGHEHHPLLLKIAQKLTRGGTALVWFRTCETFGAAAGQAFAKELSTLLGARVAGHTHIIGILQSGLQGLAPGEEPHWAAEEGLAKGSAQNPKDAHTSSPSAPRTVHFLNGKFPEAWFKSPGA